MRWLALLLLLAACGDDEPARPDLLSTHNRGVGLMGRFEYAQACDVFARLAEAYPDNVEVKVDLAIATLNRQSADDTETARRLVNEALKADATHLRARYCRALIALFVGEAATAREDFLVVAKAAPDDAYAAYHVGLCHVTDGEFDQALPWYQKALAIEPYLRSGYYGAYRALIGLRRADDAKPMLDAFERLRTNPQARMVAFKYTQMGPLGEVQALDAKAPGAPARAATPFGESEQLLLGGTWGEPGAATACDIDGDGRIDLFCAGHVLLQRDSGFTDAVDHPLAKVPDVLAALWGDFDNDGRTDVYLCRAGPNQLWRNGPDGWKDVTAATKTAGGARRTVDGAMFDADHDGDLDVLLINADGPHKLLNNNLDGTFRSLTALAGDGRPSRGVVIADFDSDRDADVLVLKQTPPHELFVNDRLWEYRKRAWTGPALVAAVAADRDANGTVELYGIAGGRVLRWDALNGKPVDVAAAKGARLAAADVDGDGTLDLVTDENPSWCLALLDAGRGPSLVTFAKGAPPRIRRPAADRPPFLALRFSGKEPESEQTRSNWSGIGVIGAARVGARWTVFDTYRIESGPGQSRQPVAFGLGGAKRADFVRLRWTDGVMQTELDLEAGREHFVQEVQRQLASCPVAYVWDGERYAFFTDLLGVGGLGFNVGTGEYGPPRPWENLLLPQGMLQPRNGRFEIKVGEPMEETCYVDAVRLVAYDLPPGWRMTLDERFAIGGPQPTGEPRFYRREVLPSKAVNDRGEDVTARVLEADLAAPEPGHVDPRFLGLTAEHTLTLEFDEPLVGGTLVIDGWIEYPYSQTMFSAWQAGVVYRAPDLEARGADGEWTVVVEQFGYPAGMPRQMSMPLPKLPAGTRALRLRTNQEIYWDRVAVAWMEPCPDAMRVEAALKAARVAEVGFPLRTTKPQRVPHYDYTRRAPFWDTDHMAGFHTEFGPAFALVVEADAAVAIIGPGEEVHFEFEPPSSAAPEGWTRRWVLETAGWCKDKDLYTKDGDTVGPLPGDPSPKRDELHRRFNTRYR